MPRRSSLALLWLVVLLGIDGCVTPSGPPIAVPPPTPPAPAMPAEVDRSVPDLSALVGRRIVLDPGHSVEFPGTSSVTGIHEAELNLRVAEQLRGVLERAGATVLMTRSDARALDRASNSADLTRRAEFANARDAEVFVSIHHNADIVPESGKNDLEVYYKISDDGPSLDLARHMTAALARRARPEAAAKRLLPGNYKVLRLVTAPAVLLETSYLTHTNHAAFIASPEGVEAEALAIAEGLNHYFKNAPLTLGPVTLDPGSEGGPELLRIACTGPVPPVAASTRVLMNGVPVMGTAVARGHEVLWQPAAPFPNGPLVADVYVQNEMGAWSRVVAMVAVNRAPAAIVVEQRPASVADGSTVGLYARVLDRFGQPVADGTPVRASGYAAPMPTVDGVVAVYAKAPLAGPVVFETGAAAARHEVVRGTGPSVALSVRDARSSMAIPGALVIGDGRAVGTDAKGWAAVPPGVVRVLALGYEPAEGQLAAGERSLALIPLERGALHDVSIVIDPAYGGRAPGAIGPDGTRAADLNLEVARRVAQRLRAAGADVAMIRDGDIEVPESERIRLENRIAPSVYVRIAFAESTEVARAVDDSGRLAATGAAYVGHYPGSTTGVALATSIAGATGIPQVLPCYLYVVQQAGAPAVVVQPGDLPHAAYTRERLRDLGDRIYDGIAAHFRK